MTAQKPTKSLTRCRTTCGKYSIFIFADSKTIRMGSRCMRHKSPFLWLADGTIPIRSTVFKKPLYESGSGSDCMGSPIRSRNASETNMQTRAIGPILERQPLTTVTSLLNRSTWRASMPRLSKHSTGNGRNSLLGNAEKIRFFVHSRARN